MPFQFRKEAIEEDLNTNFPSQGQGNPPLYYSLSEVVVPTYSINNVAEGSTLSENLQTAWDFSTGSIQITAATPTTIINNTGFWKVDAQYVGLAADNGATIRDATMDIFDGTTYKAVWAYSNAINQTNQYAIDSEVGFVVYLRSGDSLTGQVQVSNFVLNVWYRQIADVNGNLVNPLGFSAA